LCRKIKEKYKVPVRRYKVTVTTARISPKFSIGKPKYLKRKKGRPEN
jgi:hypothetical protein